MNNINMNTVGNEKTKGMLIVVSGPSGSGKGTVIKRLLEKRPEIYLSVSATTRPKRENEEDGVHYYFMNKTEFERKIKAGEMLEHAVFAENYYGTPASYVLERLENGQNVLLEIEVDGAGQILTKYRDALTVFISPPSMDELRRRLQKRGTENERMIQKRTKIAFREMRERGNYDYIVINDDLERAVTEIENIIFKPN
ncbi:MAG: guanylate kinase [Oscillospiraceae bacterium]|nr:guanylate kinase [Oscillospiraceae bacterium]